MVSIQVFDDSVPDNGLELCLVCSKLGLHCHPEFVALEPCLFLLSARPLVKANLFIIMQMFSVLNLCCNGLSNRTCNVIYKEHRTDIGFVYTQ